MHLELDEIVPGRHPAIEEDAVGALHDLKALAEIRRHPAVDVGEPFGSEPSALSKALVHWLCAAIPEMFNDKVKHGQQDRLG